MPQQDPSRTEDPTKKRIDKARKKGSVARSQELGKALAVLAGLVGLHAYINYMSKELMDIFRYFIGGGGWLELSKVNTYNLFVYSSAKMAILVLPIILFLGLVVYLATRLQVGSLWTTQVFNPKFDKIFNVIGGLQKLFISSQTFIRLGKSMLMAVVIGLAPYIVLRGEMDNILPLFFATPTGLCNYILTTASKMVIYALMPMLVISAVDLWYTRWDYNEQLKMTKDEVKDERKQAEGDPKVKAEQRQKMFAVMARRMMQDVPKADVVITNPTHFAVAIKYDPMVAPAPMVLAKGVDRVALKIKEIAKENKVPIRENKPLAQALYKSVEIGDVIPEEMYQAVASILAQIYRMKKGPQVATKQ